MKKTVNQLMKLTAGFVVIGLLLIPLRATATLTVTNNLALWLDANSLVGTYANGQAVTSWTDLSGNGRNYTQGTAGQQPTLVTNSANGQAGVRFDGLDDFLKLTPRVLNWPATGFTYAVVMHSTFNDTTTSSEANAPQTILGFLNNEVSNGMGLNGGQFNYENYDGNTAPNGWQHDNATNSLNNGAWHILLMSYDAPGGSLSLGTIRMYVDGNLVLTTNSVYHGPGYNYGFLQALGGGYNGGNTSVAADLFNGDVGAVLVYTNALTGAELLSVQNFLLDEFEQVPEPSAVLLMVVGATVVQIARRRMKKYPST